MASDGRIRRQRPDQEGVVVSAGKLVVRTYQAGDEAAVTALWRDVFPGDPPWNEPGLVIRRKRATQPDLLLVAEVAGMVVGAVVVGYDGFRGWIYHLGVAPGYRRRGFGRALMAAAETRLQDLGCPKVNLQVRATNTDVIAFYRRLGYDLEERASFGKLLDTAPR
jgi:ribosomal protein S18 acetylase RimI-like enzyme